MSADSYKPPADLGSRNSDAKTSHRRSRPSKRSEHSKRDTGHYLTHYQSSLPDVCSDGDGSGPEASTRIKHLSVTSTSSSEYSSDSNTTNSKLPDKVVDAPVSRARMRSGIPSDGGSDRRRMAIVEVDAENRKPIGGNPHDKSGSLRARRGLPPSLAGLALVAPPDAAPKSYSHLTPPFTASLADNIVHDHDERHHRSLSEAVTVKNRSTQHLSREPASRSQQPPIVVDEHPTLLQYPSPSPDGSGRHHLSPQYVKTPASRRTHQTLIKTPDIGEGKDIDIRVAGPVVINLESAQAIRRRKLSARKPSPTPQVPSQPATSSLVPPITALYQPEPLPPPPPRLMLTIDPKSPAPPRPPRLHSPSSTRNRMDIESVKQALQLPPSVTAILATRSPNTSPDKLPKSPNLEGKALDSSGNDSEIASELNRVKSVHRREGAYLASNTTSSGSETSMSSTIPSINTAAPQAAERIFNGKQITRGQEGTDDEDDDDDVPDITVVRPLRYSGQQQRNETISDEVPAASYKRRTFDGVSSASRAGEPPNPPPKSSISAFGQSPRRFSALPQTPSLSSRSTRRSSSGTEYSSRTPSPAPAPAPAPLLAPRPKIKSLNPPAMFCSEITSRRSSLERCTLYAQKINELYMYDTGLGDWTIETRYRANTNRPTIAMSAHTITPQPRHTSGRSIISEATFPIRPDASVATDLSIKTQDLAPAAPPNLPYPSLANQYLFPPRSSSSIGTSPSIRSYASSSPSNKSGGFFSSLGRKTSLSSAKKDRATPLSNTSPAASRWVKASAAVRVVNISNTPSVPGGPRAAPNHRTLRPQTLLPPPTEAPPIERNDAMTRRPSLSNISHPPPLDISSDPAFARQVDKLADLLPQADRNVLAGYLRRAGQDILAIGQYLEDEKNGTIRV